jgi:hypothetical protein
MRCSAVSVSEENESEQNGDEREREKGGKLPGSIRFESLVLGEGAVDDESEEMPRWSGMKCSTGYAARETSLCSNRAQSWGICGEKVRT